MLQLIAEGKTTKEIAAVLDGQRQDGGNASHHLMEKLDIHSTAGLVRYAIRRGLLQP